MALPPPSPENERVLDVARVMFREKIVAAHLANTTKLVDVESHLNINPFTVWYLAKFFGGDVNTVSIAKALVYPRVLGTSFSTSFGTHLQSFISDTLVTAYGSTAEGMDIVFQDHIDSRTRYAQLKLGPTTINSKDVGPINREFTRLLNLSRANRANLKHEDLSIGVMFGEEHQLNAHFLKLREQYGWDVLIGKDFWHRLTGDIYFMDRLVEIVRQETANADVAGLLDSIIGEIAIHPSIIRLAFDYSNPPQRNR